MRIDHFAIRCKDRFATAKFYVECLGYRIVTEFPVIFDDGSSAQCLVLEPPEKDDNARMFAAVCGVDDVNFWNECKNPKDKWWWNEYHLAPEIFISDGSPSSIVGRWVAENGPGLHHMAYQVESVDKTMAEWTSKGFAEFTSEPIVCKDENGRQTLKQVFTRPSELTGYVIELIERDKDGFCRDSVRQLMESTVK